MPFKSLRDLPTSELFSPGHNLCSGCTAALVARLITKIAGDQTIIVNATGCLEVSTTMYPYTAWRTPWLHVAFENAAAAASGVRAAYDILGEKGLAHRDVNVVVLAGDGGTADIGLQSLSGALERGDRLTYVCYDNEAYMNTGIQRSGTTPYGSWTTTTPLGADGQIRWKKDLMGIVIAHKVKYAATASPAYILDAANKIEKALHTKGPSFLHFLAPCVPGWKFESSQGIKIGRLAVQTGLWPLYEYEDGATRVTVTLVKRLPVIEYLKTQGRYRHLLNKSEEVAKIQEYADNTAQRFSLPSVKPA